MEPGLSLGPCLPPKLALTTTGNPCLVRNPSLQPSCRPRDNRDKGGNILLDKLLSLLHAAQRAVRAWDRGNVHTLRDLARGHFVSHLVDDIRRGTNNCPPASAISVLARGTIMDQSVQCIQIRPASRTWAANAAFSDKKP